ncbi:2-oxoglutarate ferredoxin oxidoreductase subunit alpha [Mycobacterium frederiksbergense]|uniref:2-oxoglutarate ferredoxin oxidoreductase subunit alpha n=1 Tax=Mycolicibacterium frederiksbergense TaxID=117567 RepID=A0ABT6KWU3_9MYCO|nr:2-oxoacid:acceptor oxidoreductase subunit alpha [Mycolicibacterium frederiksbergense]MDH6194731.1 2-oxoglutarate ferredoxin oxidoreductase subunit alpha [Mycolicibacterium frederiksbergense]
MGENGNGSGAAPRQKLEKVVIRFAGDSGDGMQLTGDRFTSEAALFGNDLATQPNYPAEIRAPQGTLPGVSSFQIQIADYDILTAGDRPDVLVAMNPAALKANVSDLPRGGLIIANSDEFTKRNLAKVGYESNPLEDEALSDYVVQSVAMTTLTLGAVESIGATKKDGQRAKNMFALGLLSWMYGRELEHSEAFIREKFSRKPDVAEANVLALKAGWNYGETTEAFATTYEVSPAKLKSGEYRQISGNTALAYGIVSAGHLAQIQVVLGTYPITPASDILHELSKHKNFNVLTFQAEDEIAGIGAAIGASYGGALGVTSTSGPGISLKSEAIGLAVMTELPLIVIDVQRGGPSTGLPTKTEQADLLQALFGRNGESPVAVLAPKSPSDCFDIAVEAARIAVDYHTPVIILSDGAVANGSEPWQIPDISTYPPIEHKFAKSGEPFAPYARDPETLARQFAVPGTPGLEHRIGGLEAANGSGNISYEPKNHDLMVRLRQEKIAGITVPDLEVDDPTGDAELLMLGWGSSYGPIGEACRRARNKGIKVAQAHLRHLNPLPANLGEVLRRYPKVVVPEMNLGQLALLLRGKYLVDIQSVTKVEGMAFLADEVEGIIDAALDGTLGEKEADKAKFAKLAAATIEEPTESNAVGANA